MPINRRSTRVLARTDSHTIERVESVVVIGTGVMAPGIAAACVAAGASVTIAGRSADHASAAAREAGAGVRAAPMDADTFAGCELAIETVLENLEVKLDVLAQVERWLEPDAVIATNTSSLPIATLALALDRPEHFAGLHFLNPAAVTAVVEVVPGPDTSIATLDRLAILVQHMGKFPIVLRRDYPGFIWNRIQMAVMRECLHLLDEGVADLQAIEAAVSDGLAPRWVAAGPLATSDLGGSATFRVIASELFGQLSDSASVSERLGPGFYRWSGETRDAIKELRNDALRAGRAFAERRRTVTPQQRNDHKLGSDGSGVG
jgi:3-hydroxybutyryl-CoA dehydrogenase